MPEQNMLARLSQISVLQQDAPINQLLFEQSKSTMSVEC